MSGCVKIMMPYAEVSNSLISVVSSACQGGRVKKGELLFEFDMDKVKAAGHPITILIIITNTDDYEDIIPCDAKNVKVAIPYLQ